MTTSSKPAIRLIDGRPMQCKDIPDDVFLDAVRRSGQPGSWRMRWDVRRIVEAQLGPIPEKLFLAKAHSLWRRQKLGGCTCGCRGNYHLPEECGGNYLCCGFIPKRQAA